MELVENPFQTFVGLDGKPLALGFIYVGVENQDPESNPKAVFWDEAATQPAAQPIRTIAGMPDNSGSPGNLWIDGAYSLRVRDVLGQQVFYEPTPMGLRSALAGSGGAGLVSWLSAAAGAVIRSLADWIDDEPSVMNFIPLAQRVAIRLRTSTADHAAYFQAAQDAYANGARINVPGGQFNISLINITNRNIHFACHQSTVLKKHGNAGVASRGMFRVADLLDAFFRLSGGTADLNGEGPLGIGVPGRIPNLYGQLTVAGVHGIGGPVNCLVLAIRSSFIWVDDFTIKNSGENGLHFLNCSDTWARRSFFNNLTNYGVEWHSPAGNDDGGTGPKPDTSRQHVEDCLFVDIDDYGRGTGNGVAVGGGGVPDSLIIRDYSVERCRMVRCQRDVHLEMPLTGYKWEGVRVDLESWEARQGSVGLVGVDGYNVNLRAHNPGAAPTAGLYLTVAGVPTYGDIYGLVISGDDSDNGVYDVEIIDNRNTKNYRATDGAINAGSAVFTSAGAAFVAADVGRFIGIEGAGPASSGGIYVPHIARILSLNGAPPTISVNLDRAAVTTVAAAAYSYGGATRMGVKINAGKGSVGRGIVKAGIASGLASEPTAAGVHIQGPVGGVGGVKGRTDLSGLTVVAPATLGTVPAGARLTANLLASGKVRLGSMTVQGFNVAGAPTNFVGFDTYAASVEGKPYRVHALPIAVGQVVDTYGAITTLTPTSDRWDMLSGIALAFATIGAETVTVSLKSFYPDGQFDEIFVTSTTNQVMELRTDQRAQLMRDNRPIWKMEAKAKSSIITSPTTLTIDMLALNA